MYRLAKTFIDNIKTNILCCGHRYIGYTFVSRCIIFALCIFVLSLSSPLYAYFHVSKDQEANNFTLPAIGNSTQFEKTILALYPDVKALVNKDKKPKPFFALYSPQLSPALEIELISPLIMLSSRLDMHLDLTFSNLLFADIRLQKLLQEYFEVQERARRLLESKRVTSSPSFNKSRKIKTNSHRDEEKDRIKSIQEQKQALKNWKELETRSILSLLDNRQLNKRIDDSTLGDLVSLEKSLQGPNDFSRDISDLKSPLRRIGH